MKDIEFSLTAEFSLDVMVEDSRWHHISIPRVKVLVSLDAGKIRGLELWFDHAASSAESEPSYTWGEPLCVQPQDVAISKSELDSRLSAQMSNERTNLHWRDLKSSKIRMSFLYLFLEWPASAYGFGDAISTHSISYSTLVSLIEKTICEFNELRWKYVCNDLG